MQEDGRIYKAPEEDIPQEDIDRLKNAIDTAKNHKLGVLTGSTPPHTPRTIERCPHCFAELLAYDTGYGDSTRMGCPEHGWDRYPIIEVPRHLEQSIKDHPELTRRYVEWLLGE